MGDYLERCTENVRRNVIIMYFKIMAFLLTTIVPITRILRASMNILGKRDL